MDDTLPLVYLVVECKTAAFKGINGIMIRETAETFGIITQGNCFRGIVVTADSCEKMFLVVYISLQCFDVKNLVQEIRQSVIWHFSLMFITLYLFLISL